MKETFFNKVEVVRQLGIFAIVCFAIVSWVGARACVAFLQEAIYHSLREWLLLGNRPARTRLVTAEPIRVNLAKEAIAGVESDRF
jgi:hypothetical protein